MENLRNRLSALLMDTSEKNHYHVNIILETKEDVGLSSLEKIEVREIWQHETEGIILLKIYGNEKEYELEDFEECIPNILSYMEEYVSNL